MGKRSEVVFGNRMSSQVVKKAENSKERFVKRFGDDSDVDYPLAVVKNPYIGDTLGVSNIVIDGGVSDDIPDGGREEFDRDKGIIVGNIRMGFGHYRISMAIASAANHLGYKPYWMDLNSYSETTGGKVIEAQNKLYSMGSRISGKSKVFNKAVWEPMNYEGFRKLSYNASDQMNAELMTPVFRNVPKDIYTCVAGSGSSPRRNEACGERHSGQLAYGAPPCGGKPSHGSDQIGIPRIQDPERNAGRRGA